jgi:poly-gamma-glutamate synthesis protein (capsule biosynthesis protein)
MERHGVTYPAQDILSWLVEADVTHVSNEVSFAENCPPPSDYYTMVFCSAPGFIELLEYIDVDVVELTGNHLLDWGVEAMNRRALHPLLRRWLEPGAGTTPADAHPRRAHLRLRGLQPGGATLRLGD